MQVWTAHAGKEVVLSAGAVGTPQLLMISGVGPADHLRHHGVSAASLMASYPGVSAATFMANYLTGKATTFRASLSTTLVLFWLHSTAVCRHD